MSTYADLNSWVSQNYSTRKAEEDARLLAESNASENGRTSMPTVSQASLAREWAERQADPMLKRAVLTMANDWDSKADYRNWRGSDQGQGDTFNLFDESTLQRTVDDQWTESLFSGEAGSMAQYAPARIKAAMALSQQIAAANGAYKDKFSIANKAGDEKMHYNDLALQLADRGVTDLSQLQYKDGKWLAAGKDIGSLESARGKGYTRYQIQRDANGKPVFTSQWGDSSDKGKIAQALSIGLMFVPGIGTALGTALGASGTAAAAIGNGLINGSLSKLSGGSFTKGALGGAISAGLPNVGASLGVTNKVGQGLINGALKGGLGSAVNGGDILKGALSGAAGGGITALNPAATLGVDNKIGAGVINNATSSAVQAAIKGGSIKDAALAGAITGGINGANVGKQLGIDHKGAQGLINTLLVAQARGKKIKSPQLLQLMAKAASTGTGKRPG